MLTGEGVYLCLNLRSVFTSKNQREMCKLTFDHSQRKFCCQKYIILKLETWTYMYKNTYWKQQTSTVWSSKISVSIHNTMEQISKIWKGEARLHLIINSWCTKSVFINTLLPTAHWLVIFMSPIEYGVSLKLIHWWTKFSRKYVNEFVESCRAFHWTGCMLRFGQPTPL